jgi:hypothetical protein
MLIPMLSVGPLAAYAAHCTDDSALFMITHFWVMWRAGGTVVAGVFCFTMRHIS